MGGIYEKNRNSHHCRHVCHACIHHYGHDYDADAFYGLIGGEDMKENMTFFWIVCLITSLGAIFWSATSLMQQPAPLFIAFLVINVISLITNAVCWIIDFKQNKKQY